MCWGVIFLLGGGFALAAASQNSGLSSLLVEQLEMLNLSALPQPIVSFYCLVAKLLFNSKCPSVRPSVSDRKGKTAPIKDRHLKFLGIEYFTILHIFTKFHYDS